MLGLLYLILAVFFGYLILDKTLPKLFNISKLMGTSGKINELKGWMVKIPAAFFVGTLLLAWTTYLCAYLFRKTEEPLIYGNIISTLLFAALSIFIIIKDKNKYSERLSRVKNYTFKDILKFLKENLLQLIFVAGVTGIYSYMIFHSFYISNGTMNIGSSVYSDFGPHTAMIRSFSVGSNFPTEYPHFADGHVRYHFFFQFIAGNLEFLGMRIDWAFNLPSILSMVFFLMLLQSFAVVLFKRAWIGIIAVVLYIFRSSFAVFTFLWEQGTISRALSTIMTTDRSIGKTNYEDWGLWAQKTFINQRHFAFGMGILLITLLVLYPTFKSMYEALMRAKKEGGSSGEKGGNTLKLWFKEFILTKDAWLPESYLRPVILGAVLGLAVFWNGAIVIATLPILFIAALFSKHRLEYLITALITVGLSYAETSFFFGVGASTVDPQLVIGFVAPDKSLYGISAYFVELFGILPVVCIAGIILAPKGIRWLALAFMTPFVLAITLQLTPDIAVNHKYVFVTIILINMFAACFIYYLFKMKNAILKVIAALLLLVMTSTGIIDFFVLNNLDKMHAGVRVDDPLKEWVIKNTEPDEIFLTDIYVLHPILLAGRKLYYGWPYFAWSAGYDTSMREVVQKQIYGSSDGETVKNLVKENNISYIVIDDGNRSTKDYVLNEALIRSLYPSVYRNENIEIFKTN